MTRVFTLPDLGEGLTEAEVVRWLVSPGDEVRVDQPIVEVETAKSIVEVPSPFAGRVAAVHGAEGETLAVGAPLLEVDDGSAPAPAPVPTPAASAEAYRAEERAGGGSGNVLIGYGTTGHEATTRRRPVVPTRHGIPPAKPVRTGGPVAVRSPIVRRLARERGVDLRAVAPSGADGAITRVDVLRAATASTPAPATADRDAATGLPVAKREPLGMLRRTVSAKLSRSRAEIPEATVWVDVDATELWNLRRAMASHESAAPSVTALLARFTLLALEAYPALGGRLDGDELVEFAGVNLGVAVDTPRGLMVPVLRGAHTLTVAELDAEVRRVSDLARAGSASPEQLTGSTFTLNNYGSLGVDGSAAIINHPEVAILGVGRAIERPWVVDGAVVPRRILQLSLVFDHRVCDGGYAAGFLRAVSSAIEHPARLFSRV